MKKWFVFLLVLAIVLAIGSVSFASDKLTGAITNIKLFLNGNDTDQEVVAINGSNYVPVRAFGKLLGFDVEWDGKTRSIYLNSKTDGPSADPSKIEKTKPEFIAPDRDIDEYGGADSYDNGGDDPKSRYYVNPDFYHMKSDDRLTILEQFKTFNQTSEWSCGSASILMVLNHFGFTDVGEWEIAVKSGAHRDLDVEGSLPGTANNPGEYGTSVDDIVRFFDEFDGLKVIETSYKADYTDKDLITPDDISYCDADRGNLKPAFSSNSLYTSDNDDASENWVEDAKDSYFVKWLKGHLTAGRPIMVEWGDWDGHWQAIIGYDSNGTPGVGDDILIFADPYDTSDHWQDGYYYYPLERWFYMWKDRTVAPKPFQLQPFVVVDKE